MNEEAGWEALRSLGGSEGAAALVAKWEADADRLAPA